VPRRCNLISSIRYRIQLGSTGIFFHYSSLLADLNDGKTAEFRALYGFCKFVSVSLYGYETWSLTLREEHRLRVLENRVLRRIFGPKRVEVTGGWGKLHNEELHHL
jgi:hypothetical protein